MKKEAELQKACVTWFQLQYPQFSDLLVAIPNGGSRNIMEAVNLKKQGVKPGIPDLVLFVQNESKAVLFIELKVGRNKLTEHQQKYFDLLPNQGYQVEEVRSFDQFRIIIERYLLFLSDK